MKFVGLQGSEVPPKHGPGHYNPLQYSKLTSLAERIGSKSPYCFCAICALGWAEAGTAQRLQSYFQIASYLENPKVANLFEETPVSPIKW